MNFPRSRCCLVSLSFQISRKKSFALVKQAKTLVKPNATALKDVDDDIERGKKPEKKFRRKVKSGENENVGGRVTANRP